ncbi:NAD-dependent epimerase/dehydratase family protein [Flavobacteriaceae bacterium]|nr:NAD-dependent epimerase/dehydratase family protein [Flavobacteriaceae bacterium]
MKTKTILVTGAAGFIGFHLSKRLSELGHTVIGIDNINDYYDINLKYNRLKCLGVKRNKASEWNSPSSSNFKNSLFTFIRTNIEDTNALSLIFKTYKFDLVCHLAAQAFVRSSLEHSNAYLDSNIVGFLNVLECCRKFKIPRLVYASSSSVYGNTSEVPFQETAKVDRPLSMYAVSKKTNELMAHAYSHLYGIETIGLRFFTVYGPWGRPDMALFVFTESLLKRKPININNHGNHMRDFTYIDDIIKSAELTLLNKSNNKNLYKIYNIGNNNPVKLLDFVNEIEITTGLKSELKMQSLQPGDAHQTWASTNAFMKDYEFQPKTPLKTGIDTFYQWYKSYY